MGGQNQSILIIVDLCEGPMRFQAIVVPHFEPRCLGWLRMPSYLSNIAILSCGISKFRLAMFNFITLLVRKHMYSFLETSLSATGWSSR